MMLVVTPALSIVVKSKLSKQTKRQISLDNRNKINLLFWKICFLVNYIENLMVYFFS